MEDRQHHYPDPLHQLTETKLLTVNIESYFYLTYVYSRTMYPCRGLATVFSSFLFGPQPENTEGSRSPAGSPDPWTRIPHPGWLQHLLNHIQGIRGRFCMLLSLLYTLIWGMFSLQFNRTQLQCSTTLQPNIFKRHHKFYSKSKNLSIPN